MITMIAALSQNNVIGVDNRLPWHLPADLAFFKQKTLHHTVLMGRHTYDSIGKALPKRTNVVLTRDPNFQAENVRVAHTLNEALALASSGEQDELFVIGGAMLYEACMPFAQKLYLTRVLTMIENGTAFFPEPDPANWKKTASVIHEADENNAFTCIFETYLNT